MAESEPVTDTFVRWRRGEPGALDALLPRVYDELRTLAASHMRRERADHTLQPTALVHEVFLRLIHLPVGTVQDRLHFYALAAQAMRRILADHARRARAAKRGGGAAGVPVDMADEAGMIASDQGGVAADDLDTLIEDLARLDPRQARVVELRFFGGLTVEETAEVLGVSPVTVKRDWMVARAWLHRELRGTGSDGRTPAAPGGSTASDPERQA
jgi:RNA polymerase sigma factor (TIGR02999 family)